MADALSGFDKYYAPKAAPASPAPGDALSDFDKHYGARTTATPAVTPQTVTPPAPPAPAQVQGPPGNFLSLRGPGWDPLPQSVDDWTNRFANDVTLHASPTLRAQSSQADPRMSMAAKLTADTAGQLNPTQLLRAVPIAGPALQGAAQEGIRSYMDGRQGWDLAGDAGKGALAGLLSQGLTSPEVMAHLASKAATVGLPAAAGYFFGGDLTHSLAGGFAGREFLDPLGAAIKDRISQVSLPPAATQALQNLIMGPASTLIQAGRDNPQTPPLPGFGYPGN